MSEARKCPMCDGAGKMMKVLAFGFMSYPPCGICGGKGEIVETETDRLRAALIAAEKFIARQLHISEGRTAVSKKQESVWVRSIEPTRALLTQVRAALGRPT